ncbi:M23 family metallopeptidase [Hydrotalea sp.]|uniref:M23 family metallopeptidase n=1 Tax=Hydrotalea sp. TaxID=2881279 RepID=UPI0026231AFA|nr:M23 family metallopeptidase [Hydrotalea sp.]
MRKIKYYYNTHTLRFEKLEVPLRVRILQVIGFIAATLVTGILLVLLVFQFVDSPKEKLLRQQNRDLAENYTLIQERVKQLEVQMQELEDRDNNVYRTIFESTPIPDSARTRIIETKNEIKLLEGQTETELVNNIKNQLNNLTLRVVYQGKSYGDIDSMIKNKEKLLLAIPAIQPVSNKNLNRIASGFGYRIDPVYKVTKFHAGLDFAAPLGTPIYATADGVVQTAGFNTGGYGNEVVINHGYGYQTLYGHMYKVKAREGELVKRGEVIGYVGSTGKSTGPHCHYEVHKNGKPVDPIYYFYNDLTPAQFDRILKLAATANQSLD